MAENNTSVRMMILNEGFRTPPTPLLAGAFWPCQNLRSTRYDFDNREPEVRGTYKLLVNVNDP
ncbi:MAG: hypothetical protein U1E87_00890 [Alphaproteobacteria bacterium]